jgi:dihydrofolate reductase
MRKVIYHVAASVDGFIGHTDSSVDGFLQTGEHANDYLSALQNDYDVVLMGRKTYEFGLQFGVSNPYPWMKQYIFSSHLQQSPNANLELVNSDFVDLLESLKAESGKDLYLCGGGGLAATFLAANLIDELIIKLNPVLFGTGIPLFRQTTQTVALNLLRTKVYSSGVVLLHYAVALT